MTETQFRRLALSFPGAEERSHMGHPDFRVNGKIFATLQPTRKLGVVKLAVDQQELLLEREPETFVHLGGWSRQGWTGIHLPKARVPLVRELLRESCALVAFKPNRTSRRR